MRKENNAMTEKKEDKTKEDPNCRLAATRPKPEPKMYEAAAEAVRTFAIRRSDSGHDVITPEDIKRRFGLMGLKAFAEAEKRGWVVLFEDEADPDGWWYEPTLECLRSDGGPFGRRCRGMGSGGCDSE
jgi:hypothetical protein